MKLTLPETAGHLAFTSDLSEASGVLNHGFLGLLQDELELRDLTFESGIVHTVLEGPILPNTTVRTVDTIVAARMIATREGTAA